MKNAPSKQKRKRRTREEIEADKCEAFRKNSQRYYAKQYPPEYYTCIEHSRENLRGPGKLDERYVKESMARQQEVGIEEYIWRTCRDGRVCSRCAAYEGKKFRYDSMPPGGHPGLAAGCRCYASPVMDVKNPASTQRKKVKSGGCVLSAFSILAVLCAVVWTFS